MAGRPFQVAHLWIFISGILSLCVAFPNKQGPIRVCWWGCCADPTRLPSCNVNDSTNVITLPLRTGVGCYNLPQRLLMLGNDVIIGWRMREREDLPQEGNGCPGFPWRKITLGFCGPRTLLQQHYSDVWQRDGMISTYSHCHPNPACSRISGHY